jgi:hypothetical protein
MAMPQKGRPRLTLEEYQARLKDYCARYGVQPSAEGLAPFPAGRRETVQHREWLKLYKLHSRLGRRQRGQCERCDRPAGEGSIFCDAHRAAPTDAPPVVSVPEGACPICGQALEGRSPLHSRCQQLVDLAQSLAPSALDRARAYLADGSTTRKPRKRLRK